ncbi:hypothetical protein T459_26649 [Capsicum annuum]|uniref:Disease resistance protein At4g27190-like leucine-rich repeats domain-containing protein n=1 Tax=Capsicum annuum TaxID=4072 RepID=A0A2G2YPE1_CAPAN|nr:hypothetical protein T459_26649 [Capsicum annuum]
MGCLQVSCPKLEVLELCYADNISVLCSHQLPTAYFNKLEILEVRCCGKLTNLMSPLVARGFLNIRKLKIEDCPVMEEVITEDERQGKEIMTNEPLLFPRLEELYLEDLPKLGHFFLTKCALEFPFLILVKIRDCPEMKTFVQQRSVSIPNLKSVNHDDALKVVDPMFNSKVSCPNLENLCVWGNHSITVLCSHQLPTAYFSKLEILDIQNCGQLRKLMSPLVARVVLNLRILHITNCPLMEEVISEEEQQGEEMNNEPLFLRLEELYLEGLPKLGHFFLTKPALEFPFLELMKIDHCPEMKTFIQQGFVSTPSLRSMNNDDEVKVDDVNRAMFNSKVSFPSLEKLSVDGANGTTALCSHQLPTGYLNKLEILEVRRCRKWRNLMSPSVARGLLNLRNLKIEKCPLMNEVITEEEHQGEEMSDEPLFPLLEELYLTDLPKLRHFFLTKHTLEFSFLREVNIHKCPEMNTFVQQGSVSTPNLEILNYDNELEVDDLNKWIQQSFNSKEQQEQGNSDEYQSEATDGDKSEASEHDESDATNDDESETTESLKGEP